MIGDALETVKQNLIYVVVGSLFAGLAAGQVVGPATRSLLKQAVLPALLVMIYPMMINLDVQEIFQIRNHLRAIVLGLVVNFVIAPAVAVGLAQLFFAGDPYYAVGLYLIALIPTSGMTAAWTGLAGGDLENALVAIAVNLIVAVFVLPPYLSVLVGDAVGFDPAALYRQLATVVVIPMVAGNLTRRWLLHRYDTAGFKRLKPKLGGVSSVGVMVIVFIAMTMQSGSILAAPVASALVIVPLVAFYALILTTGAAIGRTLLDNAQSVALVYATSMRSLSVALAIAAAPGFPPAEAVLPIALAYLIQPTLGAVYMHYRRDIVGQERGLMEAVRSWAATR
ncbi:arsenic resistance protein [Natrinema hispanicum]|uniref:Arsenite efflux pump ArsB, ACR3 family n=1 Tax=Natrinema hispanicum TaxID=392421 RepID=A0A1G6VW89_9EURY|nr:bile acid:sodium symporter [Natrinema hispanicum]SDD57950.1 Arsenite efflux pump ArsB, ACR3 family [Natrinema hispanicum]SET95663.1 Arsenite efflux pump ArsB, ACR3 family [Natrinema hispanicum]